MTAPADALQVTQVALGRFHHFHLARQLQKRGLLKEIWTGYLRSKLKDERGIPAGKIRSFPWLYVPEIAARSLPGLRRSQKLYRELHWAAVEALDRRVAARIDGPGVVVALSSGGLHCGARMQALGGRYICDRGSSHIRFQDALLREEFRRWDLEVLGVDPRVLAKEEAEYERSDFITIPSDFCRDTFVAHGVPERKIRVVPYGGRLDRFTPTGAPAPDAFTVLFVGGVSIRKGVPYLLQAFAKVRHPNKRLKIIGHMQDGIQPVLANLPLDDVDVLGGVPNAQLAEHYSTADVMVLPSLEEGLALVMAEAMACGCPVIATTNSGASNLFEDGKEGLIVPIRSSTALAEALERVAQDRDFARTLRRRARACIQRLGGYDRYGDQWEALLRGVDPMVPSARPSARLVAPA